MSVEVSGEDGIAVVRMNNGKVNALDTALCDELSRTFNRLGDDATVRAVVLTGNDRAFSAGVDLPGILAAGPAQRRAFVDSLSRCFQAVLLCRAPTVGAVNGHAIAGGCVLANAVDYRVAADTDRAQIGLTELAVGVPFPTAAIEIMRWRLGDQLLGSRILPAGTVPLSQAVTARLADEVLAPDQLAHRAVEMAWQLAAVPPASYALTKAQLQADVRERITARCAQWDGQVADAWAGEEVGAAMRAFVDKTLRR